MCEIVNNNYWHNLRAGGVPYIVRENDARVRSNFQNFFKVQIFFFEGPLKNFFFEGPLKNFFFEGPLKNEKFGVFTQF